MSKPPMSAKLARIVRTKDGALLRPRGEAAEYMTGLPAQRARYQAWQFAAKLLLGGDDAEALTRHAHHPLVLAVHTAVLLLLNSTMLLALP